MNRRTLLGRIAAAATAPFARYLVPALPPDVQGRSSCAGPAVPDHRLLWFDTNTGTVKRFDGESWSPLVASDAARVLARNLRQVGTESVSVQRSMLRAMRRLAKRRGAWAERRNAAERYARARGWWEGGSDGS